MTLSDLQAKAVAMVVVGVGSLLTGLIPAYLTNRRVERRLLLSLCLCFGAGVLLATSILHMLPETRKGLPLHAELVLCAGFFLLYMVDEIVHLVWGEVLNVEQEIHSHQVVTEQRNELTHDLRQDNALATHGDHPPSTAAGYSNSPIPDQIGSEEDRRCNRRDSYPRYGSVPQVQPLSSNVPASDCGEEQTLLNRGRHTQSSAHINTGLAGLLIALTLHAILEGLAVGLQTDANKVFLLMVAVLCHKLVVGFCLGMEFATTASSFSRHSIAIGMFSGGSVIGISIGMMVTQLEDTWISNTLMPVLQGIAAGTLLYVTVSEVLPRERGKWHKTPRRVAGAAQLFSVICGFSLILMLLKYTEELDGDT